ncbi:Re/Si-specific NAD(P)(+) transhydrogenase subunit alpha [Amycolatopsis sp. FDAARGOS 1241]|uniref:Re/Si-specific NAD(P)(+) transhydrogenase subunit alpha n=1 Tax=Amycolatopsis sp. FDAARGOS 1241 TaxID=2778070 RepID=UPI00194E6660|nr:Re/Si-specific NAD(P)(+) transhydrogenase subunit alpha [Amycolatopsis sp. FDAARGOS 1241]QRP49110.1 Re/Si-specific NAD(P)(+) transhydrogenase subunit alpha [Amycolatopsis sp. FDAARGOS 1241]
MTDHSTPPGPPLRIGLVAEPAKTESRVALTPDTVRKAIGLGYSVVVESGAGVRSGFGDEAYLAAGAEVSVDPAWDAEVVVTINPPDADRIEKLLPGTILVSMLAPALEPERLAALAARGVTALAMDAVPRISRAQSLDVLSSMANIAGYRAVIEAAHVFGRFFTGQVTAAGKVPPAKVLVAGAGVAGLAAIAAANSLGAVVRATDPRPEVADQVRSLGGEYLAVEVEQEASTDGYAKATSEAYDKRAAEIYSEQAADVDIVITTALIPGRPAPKLLTAEQVALMKPGSVVVDMAAAQGGNVAGTVAGEVVTTDNGVTIIGYTDLPGRLPAQASQLYGTNVVNLLKLLTPEKDGRLTLDFDDVVQRGLTVVRDGEVLWPPPPVSVSAAPQAAPAPRAEPEPEPEKPRSPWPRFAVAALGAVALFLASAFAPPELAGHLTVFVLAIVIGFYVIGNVHHALHTPLMSVTNAISGIIVVGAILQIAGGGALTTILAAAAVLLAAINIVGGFTVTRRMLSMFSRS